MSAHIERRAGLAFAALLALACSAAPTAPSIQAQTHAPALRETGPQNMNWGGYIATGTGRHAVSASWVNPKVDCTVRGVVSFWVGIDGWLADSKTIQQLGVDANCLDGTLRYRPWYEMWPASSVWMDDLKTLPGDAMSASVTTDDGTYFTLTISDTTQNWTHSVKRSAPTAKSTSAEVIVEPTGTTDSVANVPDFGTVNFTNAMVDGQSLDTYAPVRSTLVRNYEPLAETGDLAKGAFPVTWKKS